MTFLAQFHPTLLFTGVSRCGQSITRLDRDVVADAVGGANWSVEYHEAPDHETSLVVLPDEDEYLSTFVLSVAGSHFCLQECRHDVLHRLGEFGTLEEAVTALRRVMSGQTN